MCCAFRDGILHTLVVTSVYLSYCCLSIISNQSAHSPLTSDINKAFLSTQLPLTGYFHFFWPFSVNSEMVVRENLVNLVSNTPPPRICQSFCWSAKSNRCRKPKISWRGHIFTFVLVSWQEVLVNESAVTAWRYDWRVQKEEVGSCIKAVLQECQWVLGLASEHLWGGTGLLSW